jgi:threonine aldolase
MHAYVDLRSDTVTKPTPAMRHAMAEAEVDDDVLGRDPTVQRLEEVAARKMGKEAALFVPSGTMSNTVAIKTHTEPGDEILLDWNAHSMTLETAACAVICGVLTRPFRSYRGVPDVEEIANAIHTRTMHTPGTTLLILENTHNRAGGAIIPLEVHRELYTLAKEKGLKVHLDGARIFNAAVATSIPASEYAQYADSVTFCLSKGLCCPVGSVLCGTQAFIDRARRVRKLLGGAMRQAGVLAACGLVALETMIDRLADDHRNARRLAQGIAGLPGITVDVEAVQTNMVYFDTAIPATEFVEKLASRRVRCVATAPNRIRMVTHHDVDTEDIEYTIGVFHKITTP